MNISLDYNIGDIAYSWKEEVEVSPYCYEYQVAPVPCIGIDIHIDAFESPWIEYSFDSHERTYNDSDVCKTREEAEEKLRLFRQVYGTKKINREDMFFMDVKRMDNELREKQVLEVGIVCEVHEEYFGVIWLNRECFPKVHFFAKGILNEKGIIAYTPKSYDDYFKRKYVGPYYGVKHNELLEKYDII